MEKINTKKIIGGLLTVTLVALAVATYFYIQFVSAKNNPQKFAEEDAQKLVAEVSKLILLPQGETPTVATVTDPEKLSSQPFFLNAKKGDKVLIFTSARKAVLYDPVENKIIEVAPISIGQTSTAAGSSKP